MDTLFETLNLKSWSIYENSSGTVVNLRFCDNLDRDNTGRETAQPIEFTKKSQAQMKRDKQRMDNFIRPRTRSQLKSSDIENVRCNDSDKLLSDTVLSVDSVHSRLNPDASPFHVISESPAACSLDSRSVTDIDANTCDTFSTGLDSMPSLTDSDTEIGTDDNCDSNSDIPPIPKIIPVDDETPPVVNCDHSLCAYRDTYQPGHDYETHENPDVVVYTCALCQHLYVCDNCKKSGAHKGHTAWMRAMQKSPND